MDFLAEKYFVTIVEHDNIEKLKDDTYHLVPENIKARDIILLEKIFIYFHRMVEVHHRDR